MALKDYRGRSGSSRSRMRSFDGVSKRTRAGYGTASNWFSLTKSVRERDTIPGVGLICVICGKPIEPGQPYETHHLQSLSRGGSSEGRNLGTVHRECHDKRHRHLARAGANRDTITKSPAKSDFRKRLRNQRKNWK